MTSPQEPWTKGRIPLHMVEALPLRSVWRALDGGWRYQKPPHRHPPLVHWWLKGALLLLASAVLAVAVVKILRAGML